VRAQRVGRKEIPADGHDDMTGDFGSLNKKTERFIMGADCSTKSFAFSVFDNGSLIKWGEITFKGNTVFERLADGQKKVRLLKQQFKVDRVVIESAVFVQNKKTVILLAYSFGAIIAALIDGGAVVEEVSPLVWQRAIQNPPLTKPEKQAIVDANPDKSKAWYTNANRLFRKHRTRVWVRDTYGIDIDNDNVTDAIAIAGSRFIA